jgi:hypothetical protein
MKEQRIFEIVELVAPGSSITDPDKGRARRIAANLKTLETAFFDAHSALILFDEQMVRIRERCAAADAVDLRAQFDARCREDREIREEVAKETGGAEPPTWSLEYADFDLEVQSRHNHKRWRNGELPRQLEDRKILIAARAFVFALDNFANHLRAVSRETGNPRIDGLTDEFHATFPHLTEVRNTAHHPEDRARNLDRHQRPIELKAVDNYGILAPAGLNIADSLRGNQYYCTNEGGFAVHVEISIDSLTKVRNFILRAYACFEWAGGRQHKLT